jgi:microcystin-dependent protein
MSEPFIGQILYVGFNFAPRGWATCDGQLLSIAQNTALFSLLGTTYGGNGQTTFALPDLRSRVPVHQGQGPGLSPYVIGQQAGSESVTLTTGQLPAHTHTATLNAATNKATAQSPTAGALLAKSVDLGAVNALPNIYVPSTVTPTTVALGGLTVNPAGSSQPVPVLQPYLTLTAIIALQGIFPSRN